MTNNLNFEIYSKFQELRQSLNTSILDKIFRDESTSEIKDAKKDWEFLLTSEQLFTHYSNYIENQLFGDYYHSMYKMVDEAIKYSKFNDNKWHTEINNLTSTIRSTKSYVNGILERVWQQVLPFVIQDIRKKEQIDEERARSSFEHILRNSFDKLWGEEIKPIQSKFNDFENKTTKIQKDIEDAENNLKKTLTAVQFKATVKNIEDVRRKNNHQIVIWGIISTLFITFIFCTICYSFIHINDVFYNVKLLPISDDLKKMYIIKNSLTSLTLLGIISFCLVNSIRLLKKYLNIHTIYNHKLALLNSFQNLMGQQNFEPQERLKIIERLVEQIITSDHITLQEQGHSSPSIIQPIAEIINGGKQN